MSVAKNSQPRFGRMTMNTAMIKLSEQQILLWKLREALRDTQSFLRAHTFDRATKKEAQILTARIVEVLRESEGHA